MNIPHSPLRPLAAVALVGWSLACAGAAGGPAPTPAPVPAKPAADTVASAPPGAGMLSAPNADPFPSTYTPYPSKPTVIQHATILTAAGPAIHDGTVVLRDGRIVAVGTTVDVPADAVIIDGTGKYVTPGIIDIHSHLGVYAAPGEIGRAHV